MRDVVGVFSRSGGDPAGLGEVLAERSAEIVSAALCDDVDHAASEPSVLGRNSAEQYIGFLDGVLNVQIVRLSEQIVVHVDAVDEEDVVVREATRNRDLAGVGRVVGE